MNEGFTQQLLDLGFRLEYFETYVMPIGANVFLSISSPDCDLRAMIYNTYTWNGEMHQNPAIVLHNEKQHGPLTIDRIKHFIALKN